MTDVFVHISILLEKNSLELSETSGGYGSQTGGPEATCGLDNTFNVVLIVFKIKEISHKKSGSFCFS